MQRKSSVCMKVSLAKANGPSAGSMRPSVECAGGETSTAWLRSERHPRQSGILRGRAYGRPRGHHCSRWRQTTWLTWLQSLPSPARFYLRCWPSSIFETSGAFYGDSRIRFMQAVGRWPTCWVSTAALGAISRLAMQADCDPGSSCRSIADFD